MQLSRANSREFLHVLTQIHLDLEPHIGKIEKIVNIVRVAV